MEMDSIKKNVSKNIPHIDEQAGLPGPSELNVGDEQLKKKPRITNIEVVHRPNAQHAHKPRSKSRKRMSALLDANIDTSDADNDGDGYRSADSVRSSVSGVSLRSVDSFKKKRMEDLNRVLTQRGMSDDCRDEDPVVELSSDNECTDTTTMTGLEKRLRGRPPTTGKGILKREIKAQKDALEKLKKETEEAENIARGQHDPAEYRKTADYDRINEIEREIKLLSTRHIAAHLLETAKKIHGVATRSSNLKGTMVRALKDASMMVQVGVDVISGRKEHRESAVKCEVEELREELKARKKECEDVEMLRRENETLREALVKRMPPPPSSY